MVTPAPGGYAAGRSACVQALAAQASDFTLTPALSRQGRGSSLPRSRLRAAAALLALATAFASAPAPANGPSDEPLPKIGPAPTFTLIDQNGKRFSLPDLRGRVAVVTFIFTTCSDTCPPLTAKLVGVGRQLKPDEPVRFVGITVDPLHDSPAVLKRYAEAFSAQAPRFAFLTGDFDTIHKVVRGYGVYYGLKDSKGGIEHTFLETEGAHHWRVWRRYLRDLAPLLFK